MVEFGRPLASGCLILPGVVAVLSYHKQGLGARRRSFDDGCRALPCATLLLGIGIGIGIGSNTQVSGKGTPAKVHRGGAGTSERRGHNYTVHNYIGHDYIGHNYIAHNYIDYMGNNYTRRRHVGATRRARP